MNFSIPPQHVSSLPTPAASGTQANISQAPTDSRSLPKALKAVRKDSDPYASNWAAKASELAIKQAPHNLSGGGARHRFSSEPSQSIITGKSPAKEASKSKSIPQPKAPLKANRAGSPPRENPRPVRLNNSGGENWPGVLSGYSGVPSKASTKTVPNLPFTAAPTKKGSPTDRRPETRLNLNAGYDGRPSNTPI